MTVASHPKSTTALTRREALQRAVAFLGGAVLSRSLFTSVLHAQAAPSAAGSLTATQRAVVTALAERILPRTDTPGATDVGVPAFIELMHGAYLESDDKAALETALTHFETAAQQTQGKGYADLSAEQQDALLRAAAESTDARMHFRRIRELTIVGYFTSEKVGKDVLHFDPIPGPFQACIPLDEVGNVSWTHSR